MLTYHICTSYSAASSRQRLPFDTVPHQCAAWLTAAVLLWLHNHCTWAVTNALTALSTRHAARQPLQPSTVSASGQVLHG